VQADVQQEDRQGRPETLQSDKSDQEADPFLPIGRTTSEVERRGHRAPSLPGNVGSGQPLDMVDAFRR